jgi:prephenate dehydrogenase
MNITIIGTGLMGCSLGLALKKNGHFISGVDHNPTHLEQAISIGAIDRGLPIHDALTDTDLVALCVPVDATVELLTEIMDLIPENTTVMDMGSTKLDICQCIKDHARRNNFVPVHPMAGVEHSGPLAAHVDLYHNAKVIICEPQKSSYQSLNVVLGILQELKMRVIFMDTEDHDRQLALVSHLPQVLAYALASLGDFDLETNKQWVDLGGGGLQSSIRLGKSDANMWVPVFQQNKVNLLNCIDNFINHLNVLRESIENDNQLGLRENIDKANINYEKLNYKQNKIRKSVELQQGSPKVFYS